VHPNQQWANVTQSFLELITLTWCHQHRVKTIVVAIHGLWIALIDQSKLGWGRFEVAPQIIFKLKIANAVYRLKMPALKPQDCALINSCVAVGWRLLDVVQTCFHKEQVRSITASIGFLANISLLWNFYFMWLSVHICAHKFITVSALFKLNIVEMRLWADEPEELL